MSLLHERYVVLVETDQYVLLCDCFLVLSERYVFHAYVLCATRVQICQFNNTKTNDFATYTERFSSLVEHSSI